MQIAVNAVMFVIVFVVVTKPMQIRKAINQFIRKLRFVTNGFKLKTPTSEREEAALLPDDVDEIRLFSHSELLTRFVTCLAAVLARLTSH
jgi:hypothetical protein